MSRALKHCPTCRRPCLVVEDGTVYPVGGTRIVEAAPDRTRARCECGSLVEWLAGAVHS